MGAARGPPRRPAFAGGPRGDRSIPRLVDGGRPRRSRSPGRSRRPAPPRPGAERPLRMAPRPPRPAAPADLADPPRGVGHRRADRRLGPRGRDRRPASRAPRRRRGAPRPAAPAGTGAARGPRPAAAARSPRRSAARARPGPASAPPGRRARRPPVPSGSRAISSCKAGRRLGRSTPVTPRDRVHLPPRRSLDARRRWPRRWPATATRWATRWSQPPSDLVVPDRAGLAGQDEERRLEGVLGVVRVAEDAPADGQDHRPVPRHQGRERRLVAPGDEPPEQRGVGRPATAPPAKSRPICRRASPIWGRP